MANGRDGKDTISDTVAVDRSSTISTTLDAERQPVSMAVLSEAEASTGIKPSNAATEDSEGVRRIENITRSWNRYALAGVYFTLWGAYLLFGFARAFTSNVGPYAVSTFGEHSLLPTISLVSYIMAGVVYIPMAKAINIYGRAESHLVMTLISAVGLILLAACRNVETYAAGVILSELGFNGLIYAVDIITADTSALKSRALAYALTATPSIITAFGGPSAAQSLIRNTSESLSDLDPIWRWSFGSVVLCLPLIAAPLYGIMFWYERRATAHESHGAQRQSSKESKSAWRRVLVIMIKFDALGLVVLAAGQVLFLLPFSLAATSEHQWASGYIIAMIVVGIALLTAFPIVEKFLSPQPFLPWRLLTDRTLLLVCAIDALFLFSNGTYQSYFTSYLQVVYDLSVSRAGYIDGIIGVVSGIWKLLIGLGIRRTKHFKWLLVPALAVHVLFLGLLIYFRRPDTATGFLIMCQLALGLASGTIVLCMNVGVVATVQHADIAATVALLGVSSYIGSAIGSAVSGAIWTNILPNKLEQLLPDSAKAEASDIYGSLQHQLSYPVGSAVRNAIVDAYASTQTWMLTAGTAIAGVALVLALMIRNIDLEEREQVTGVTL